MQQDFISILRYITILSDNTELFFSRSFEKQFIIQSSDCPIKNLRESRPDHVTIRPGDTLSEKRDFQDRERTD